MHACFSIRPEKERSVSPQSGTIQGLGPTQYAQSVRDYYEIGYRHLAIGGLVPQRDADIKKTVQAVMKVAEDLPERPWIHLFGIYRPKLQGLFRELRVDSFDSASYFRKAWLRSGPELPSRRRRHVVCCITRTHDK